jgi:acyl carrier protein
MQTAFELLKSSITSLTDTEESDILPNTPLNGVGLDSLDYVSLQLEIKRAFGVDVVYDDFTTGEIVTLGDFAKYIDSKKCALTDS